MLVHLLVVSSVSKEKTSCGYYLLADQVENVSHRIRLTGIPRRRRRLACEGCTVVCLLKERSFVVAIDRDRDRLGRLNGLTFEFVDDLELDRELFACCCCGCGGGGPGMGWAMLAIEFRLKLTKSWTLFMKLANGLALVLAAV